MENDRRTSNLDVQTSVTVQQADLQTDTCLELDVGGEMAKLMIPAHTPNGQTLCFQGMGRPDSNGVRGDLYLTVNVVGKPKKRSSKKWIGVLLLVLALVAALAAGIIFVLPSLQDEDEKEENHRHSWEDATCDTPKTCSECGDTKGDAKGHTWEEATCTAPRTCVDCGETEGEPLEHTWTEATGTTPRTCSVCGAVDEESLHQIEDQEQTKVEILDSAEAYAQNGEYRKAIQLLDDAWETYGDPRFQDAAMRYRTEFSIYQSSYLSAGKFNSAVVNSDGSVYVVGDSSDNELTANNWYDVTAVCMGDRHILGLRSDGNILMEGEDIQSPARYWTDVVSISAGDVHTVALLEDGSVVAAGYNNLGQCNVYNLMSAAGDQRIVAVSAGYYQTLALLENGRVVACGSNATGACNVSGWTDIAAIYTGTEYSAGLRTDGTVVVTESDWNVSGWTDVVMLAAGDFYLVGLRADGSVLIVGDDSGMDVSGWNGIVHIAAGHDHAIAMDANGYVLCTGSNAYGQYFPTNTKVG